MRSERSAYGGLSWLTCGRTPTGSPNGSPNKGRYVWFEGDRREKRDLRQALKYAPQPYPKRRRKGSHSGTPAGFPCLSAPSLSGLGGGHIRRHKIERGAGTSGTP